MAQRWDTVVIGAGPGGYVAAIRASQLGMRTAVVERDRVGGVCLNWGCIPTKALIHGVSLYQELRGAKQAGVVASASVDLEGLVRYSRRTADNLSKGVGHLLATNGVTVLAGHGRLVDPHTVEVREGDVVSRHEASVIVLATGSRPVMLPGLDEAGELIVDSKGAMVPTSLPQRLLIIGGGAIGVEFGYIYAMLGVKVTIVEMLPRLLPAADRDVSEELTKAFRRIGVEVLVGTRLAGVAREGGTLTASLTKGETTLTREADRMLVAVGVRPNSEDIGLEAVGISTERGFVPVDEFGHTGVGSIYAIGDLVGGAMLAHKASAQGVVAVEHAAGRAPHPVDPGLIPSCCYCEPQVAQVGPPSQQLDEAGIPYRVGIAHFASNGKAMAMGARHGFVKLLVSPADGTLLAAHLIGARVSEMIAGLALAIRERVTAARLGKLVHPHPSLSETVMEAALAASTGAIHA